MEEIKLNVQLRNQIGSRAVKNVKKENFLPAVVYGGGKGPTVIKVDRLEYEGIMRHHKGQSVVFHLNVLEGDKKLRDYSAIVKDEQYDPLSDAVTHLDFLRISLTEEIEVQVQIELKGEPVGVKKDGGSVDQTLWELDIVCLPTNIPEKLEHDISELNISDSVHVSDLKFPQGVKTKHEPEAMVCSVVPPMKEEDATEVDAEAQPEVIGAEDKKSEEGAEEDSKEEKSEDKTEEKSE